MNPLKEIQKQGQSFWLDNIRREMILSGELKKLIEEDGLRGMTSNPTIFEKALAAGNDYDESIKKGVHQQKDLEGIFDALSVEDIQMATDAFRPLFDESKGEHGHVSIEVFPQYARDTAKTIEEARRLWGKVDRPNVMIKIPATKEGLPAIEQSIYEGINVNVTLIFSVQRYNDVVEAYRKGLERRSAEGKSLNVVSVASFFVSRIDTVVDKTLQEKIESSKMTEEKDLLLDLLGKIAIANAKIAYQLFKKRFSEEWFQTLKEKGAKVQRPLWASTGTKNPHYSDVLYVDELIGQDTVNTLPPATLNAFRDHGKVQSTLEKNVEEAIQALDKLKKVKVDLVAITKKLEEDGVKAFVDSFDTLMKGLGSKKEIIEKSLTGTQS